MPLELEPEIHDAGWLQDRILQLHAECEEAARAGKLERGTDALLQLRGIVDALSAVAMSEDSRGMLHKLAVHAKKKAMRQMEKETQ